MVFTSPIWLLALLAWAGLVWTVLPGRGRPAVVPALFLWRTQGGTPRVRGRRWPGLPVALLLMAALLAIVAAAGPGVMGRGIANREVSILLDRGASMAVGSGNGEVFRGVLRRCADRLGAMPADARVTLVPVPGQAMVLPGDRWEAAANQFTATAIKTNLEQAIRNQLRSTSGPVVVLSDQKIDRGDARVMQIVSEPAADAVAMTLLAARSTREAQVMVRIENHSVRGSIQLALNDGEDSIHRDVQLPARGKSVDVFVDVKKLGDRLSASLAGETGPWAKAYAVRQGSGVLIEADSDLDESVRKMVAVYTANRPAALDAPVVRVSGGSPGADQSGVWVQSGSGGGFAAAAGVTPGDLTRDIKSWPMVGPGKMPFGFEPVVSIKQGVVVAMRASPTRAIWLNAQLGDWEKTDDFVVFFANAFDWLAGDQQHFAANPPAELGADWETIEASASGPPGERPGVFRAKETGKLLAVNAGEYPVVDQAGDSGGSVDREVGVGIRRIDSGFLFAALLCCLAAMMLWARGMKRPVPVL